MSQKPAVFVTRKLPEAVTERLTRSYEARLNPDDRPYSADEIVSGAAGAAAMIVTPSDKLRAEVIGRLPQSVRIVATFSVGFEHIDLAAAKARGIVVTNTPGVLTDATADIAMLLLLAAARRAHEGNAVMRSGKMESWSTTYLLGTHVTGKRLGIFGMGRIGQAVAKRARGFDMQIHYHDLRRLPPEAEQGAVYHDTPEDLLRHSDFFTIHTDANPQTHHFLNAERIALLPDGAIVVNCARGAIVDDAALIAALKSGKVRAAGLDVYENEPDFNPEYSKLPNTFLLPHLGSATVETRNAMGFKCLDNVDAFFAGRPCPDRLV
ncbi:MAG: D-glycerate dehydrogenase [Rhodospirillaceae bacterium]|nr:D-glycerate dehydrogenase [Rhodospirillaceae bacterium]